MKKESLPITVFMAAYNSAQYIKKSINSILNQTFKNFELLIVDDGSEDNTVDIIQSYNDPRIRLIKNDKNRGLGYTRNVALTEAKGEFIAILDSDDIAYPTRLEVQMKNFKRRPNLAVLGSYAYIIDGNGKKTGEKIYPTTGSNKIKATLLFSNTFAHSTIMMKTKIFREVGGYPNHPVAQDYALLSRIALKYEVDNLPEYLAEYRVHDTNISVLKKNLVRQELSKILAYEFNLLLSKTTKKDLDIILDPIKKSKYTIEEYYNTYRNILIQNAQKKQYPVDELHQIISNNWYQIIIEKGKYKTLLYLFRKPIFTSRFFTLKQIRKAFKKSIRYIFK